MNTTDKKYASVVIVLLIHAALLTLLFVRLMMSGNKNLSDPVIPIDPETLELKKEWAARKAPAPTIFYDPEEHVESTTATDEHTELAQAQIPEPTMQDFVEQREPEPQAQEQKQQEQSTQLVLEGAPKLQELPVKKEHTQPPVQQKAPPTQVKKPVAVKRAPPAQKQGLKLADLTHMFMEKMDHIPTGELFMQGDVSKMPPDHQIIFERYRTKVGAIIDSVRREYPCPMRLPAGLSVQLYLALNKAGKFKDIHITQSSRFEGVDDYLLFIYQEASKQFPPIPECLDEKLFKGYIRLYSYEARQGEKITQGNWFGFR